MLTMMVLTFSKIVNEHGQLQSLQVSL